MVVGGGQEAGDDVVAAGGLVRGAREQVAGVVVQPAEDLHLAAVRKAPVRDVGLPQRVGLRGLKAHERALRALARLGDDEPRPGEDPADRRRRRRLESLALEVPGDRDRSRVAAGRGQLAPQLDDPLTNRLSGRARTRLRAFGARLERIQATVAISLQQPVQVPA
jgi:hypothetical protein